MNSLSHSVKVTDLGGKDGYYITTITATDEAGNSSEQVIKTYVDTTAPTISGQRWRTSQQRALMFLAM